MLKTIILTTALILFACTPQTPEVQLNQTISEMLLLANQGRSQELLAKYADLSDTNGEITDIPKSNMKKLKFYLLRAKEMSPIIVNHGKLAIYNDPSFEMPLRFVKSGDRWLLKN